VLCTLFAALALALAAIGIFGVMRHAVEQRTREVGVRIALGAGRGTITALVIGQGLAVAAVGVGLGVAGALALTGLLSHWLVGVTPTDPLTFGAAVALLLGAALLACWLPARRAAAVDPVRALRAE
jgi:putative ABC transport system permease protein